jgi:hypothetical protein
MFLPFENDSIRKLSFSIGKIDLFPFGKLSFSIGK